jgi:uncharacterized protein YbaR (Trm112 family)
MTPNQVTFRQLEASVMAQLACPVCFGELAAGVSATEIRCLTCARVYPMVDGIPVLIPGRAIQRD